MRVRRTALGRLLSLALLVSALTTSVAVAAAPQIIRHQPKPFGAIQGRVFNTAGFAVSKARVTLQGADGSKPRTTLTDGQGRFSFPTLRIGLYHVRAASKDRSSEWRQNVSVLTGKQTTLALHLRANKPLPIKVPASLKQLSP